MIHHYRPRRRRLRELVEWLGAPVALPRGLVIGLLAGSATCIAFALLTLWSSP